MSIYANQLSKRILLVIGLFFVGQAGAAEHINVAATTEFADIHPGEPGILAITIEIDADWHTYWPGVSDSGYGLDLDIHASPAITLEDPIWPTPTRYLQPGSILDFIYEDTIVVLVPFMVNDDAHPGEVFNFDIELDALVCEEVCIPETSSAVASIEVIDSQTTPTPSASSKAIRKAFDARPIPFDAQADHVRVQWIADRAAIMFREATKIEFFPATTCTQLAEPITSTTIDTNRLIIKFASTEDKVLAGRIRSHEPGGPIDYDIHITPADSPQKRRTTP